MRYNVSFCFHGNNFATFFLSDNIFDIDTNPQILKDHVCYAAKKYIKEQYNDPTGRIIHIVLSKEDGTRLCYVEGIHISADEE